MATIKSYTTIEQSRKLAEFLPLESADMCYRYYSGGMITGYGDCVLSKSYITGKNVIRENDLPCWSLSALLDVFPCELGDNHFLVLDKEGNEYCCCYDGCRHTFADNPVDACVAMIEKLHGHKML